MKIKWVGLFLLINSFYASAQNISINGQIKDSQEEGVLFASIVFTSDTNAENGSGVITDEEGKFTILLQRDVYQMTINIVGVEPTKINLDLTDVDKEIDLGVITIDNAIVGLDEVVVTGNRDAESAVKISLDKKVYDVSKDIGARGGSLADIMANLPTVQVESDGNVSIRGNQNVMVLVNGKPSGLTSSSELFSTIPASSIDKIEVITNPSAKLDARGTAGVINVLLKDGQENTNSGSLEAFSGYRINAGLNGNFSASTENSSMYLNLGVGYSEPKGRNDISVDFMDDVISNSVQESERIRNQRYLMVNLGGSTNINSKNSISGSISLRNVFSRNENWILFEDYSLQTLVDASRRDEIGSEKINFFQGNFKYDLKLNESGHQLSAGIISEIDRGDIGSNITTNQIFPIEEITNRDSTLFDMHTNRHILSLDYTLPINAGSELELGYQGSFFEVKNDLQLDRFIEDEWLVIEEFTNQTVYDEKVQAFYGEYTKNLDKFSAKIGTRVEHTIMTTTSNENNKRIRDFTDFFPSAFFTYEFNEDKALQLAFTRRINRPTSWIVTPIATFSDDRNIFVGNEDIVPSYILGTELGYSVEVSDKLSFQPSIFYRRTTDEMEFFVERQTLTIGGEPVEFFASTIANIGSFYEFGGDVSSTFKPLHWWSVYGEIVLNGFRQRGSFRGASFDGDGILVFGRLNNNFNIYRSLKAQLQAYYRGPIETGQYKREGFGSINLGFSNEIFKGNGTLALNVIDLFNSNVRRVTTFGEDFTRRLELLNRVRQINLSVTYRFNQKQYKGKEGSQYDKIEIIN